jgi:AcrR family transcriptional regulator
MSGDDGGWVRKPGPESGLKRRICETMLEVVGDVGYLRASVDEVVERGACSRAAFYRQFADMEAASAVAYRCEAERLLAAMLAPCESESDWPGGLIAALRTVLGYVADHPARAHGMLILGQVTRGDIATVQRQIFERLTHALDSARRLPGSRHSAPPLTATMMIGAAENLLRGLLVSGEAAKAPDLLGDLTYLIVQSYFGEDEAFAAMDAARAP